MPQREQIVFRLAGTGRQGGALHLVNGRPAALGTADRPEAFAAHVWVAEVAHADDADVVVAELVQARPEGEGAFDKDGLARGDVAQCNQVPGSRFVRTIDLAS